jgi:hypothetical protein
MSPTFMAWFSDYLLVKYSRIAATTDNAAKHTKGRKKPKNVAGKYSMINSEKVGGFRPLWLFSRDRVIQPKEETNREK